MDDEELEQGGQGQKNGGRSPAGRARDFADKAKNVEKGAQRRSQAHKNKAENLAKNNKGANTAKNAKKIEKHTKKAEKMAKVAQKAGKVSQAATKLASILSTVGIILIIIIAIIGILVFIIAGFGFIMAGLQSISSAFLDAVKNLWNGSENRVKEEPIIDTLSYLKEMDYDLYGYGFVTKEDAYTDDVEKEIENKLNEELGNEEDYETRKRKAELVGKTKDEIDEIGKQQDWSEAEIKEAKKWTEEEKQKAKDKIDSITEEVTDKYGNDTGKALGYDSDDEAYRYITSYLISDNYAGTIKNNNKNFATAFSSGNFWKGFFSDSTCWGSGLISIYEESGEIIGKRGKPFGINTGAGEILKHMPVLNLIGFIGDKFEGSVDVQEGYLVVKGPGIFTHDIMKYKLDGWIGRYGMPLEFLLATHIATMAPDLSYKLATEYETDVEVLLRTISEGVIDSAINLDGTQIEYSQIEEAKEKADDDGIDETLAVFRHTGLKSYTEDKNVNWKCDVSSIQWQNLKQETETNVQFDSSKLNKEHIDSLLDNLFEKVEIEESEKNRVKDEVYAKLTGNVSNQEARVYRANKNFYTNKEGDNNFNESLTIHDLNMSNGNFSCRLETPDGTSIYININYNKEDIVLDKEVVKSSIATQLFDEICKNGYEPNAYETEDFVRGMVEANNIYYEIHARKKSEDETNNTDNNNADNNSDNNTDNYMQTTTKIDEEVLFNGKSNGQDCELKIHINGVKDSQVGITNYLLAIKCKLPETVQINYCSDANNPYTVACSGCKNYVEDICDALNEVETTDLDTYVPYINSVTDHWFRNVYFTKASMDEVTINGEKDYAIKTDSEYEKKTQERWTEYEMYEDDSGEHYELYVYLKDDNGEYKTEFAKNADDKYIVCRKVEEGKGDYVLNDDGITYSKKSGGDYKLQIKKGDKCSDYDKKPKEFRVGKKAIKDDTIQNDWVAYEEGQSNQEWTKLEIGDDSPNSLKSLQNNIEGAEVLYSADYPTVKQKDDGVRGQTNPKTKKLFLDEYYIFDGTTTTAALINKAKEMADSDDPDDFRSSFKKNKKIKVDYEMKSEGSNKTTEQEYTATIDDISGPINLTHNALSAFSILTNMHTLDAEYIYHDFKELIVELNYFDKEDLVEAEEETLMFPISGISAAGWPEVRYDKGEEFYGTLIHSAEDMEAMRKENEVELAEIAEGENSDGLTQEERVEEEKAQEEYIKRKKSEKENSEKYDEKGNKLNSQDTSDTTMNNSQFAQSNFLATAQKCWEYICDNGSGLSYGGVGCGYPFATDPSKKPKSSRMDCSGYVCWVLYEYSPEWRKDYSSQLPCSSLVNIDFTKYGWEEIPVAADEDVTSKMQPGDILIRYEDAGQHHTDICKEVDGTDYIAYDCGNDSNWKGDGKKEYGIQRSYFSKKGAPGKIVRIGGSISNSSSSDSNADVDFVGYTGSTEDAPEYVVSPATGEVVKYGVVPRKNKYTGQTDNVGYIKIRLLGTKENKPGKECTYFGGTKAKVTKKDAEKEDVSATQWLEETYKEKKHNGKKIKDTIGYDYFWDEYNNAGIGDNIVYIEGFDVSEILGTEVNGAQSISKDKQTTNKENIKNLYNYIIPENEEDAPPNSYSTQYTVPNLLDDKREYELKVGEAAKESAAYALEYDGKIFIKEGAVIGKTFSSNPEENGGITKETKVEVIDEKAEAKKQEEAQNEDKDNKNKKDSKDNKGNKDDKEDNNNGTEEENEIATKKKKYGLGNYMRIILRDTDDEVVENVEDFVEKGEGGSKEQQFDAFSVIGTVLGKKEWCQLVIDYANKNNADAIFKNTTDMGEFYDICVDKGVNPEWAFLRAIQEEGLHSDNGNYWGLGVSNGSGPVSHGDWKTTLKKFCDTIIEYQDPTSDKYNSIMERYEERKACTDNGGADLMGYGTPDTASGIQSIYSFLGKHEHGSAGAGGYYYMDPDRAGVTKIYKTHEEFVTKCQNAGGVHASGTVTTVWEQAAYTAWQVEGIIEKGKEIFGEVAGTYAGT